MISLELNFLHIPSVMLGKGSGVLLKCTDHSRLRDAGSTEKESGSEEKLAQLCE